MEDFDDVQDSWNNISGTRSTEIVDNSAHEERLNTSFPMVKRVLWAIGMEYRDDHHEGWIWDEQEITAWKSVGEEAVALEVCYGRID